MGRELRRVPANWKHPKDGNGRYIPMYNIYIMRTIKFRGKRLNGGDWVESMTMSYGTIKRKINEIFFEISPNK